MKKVGLNWIVRLLLEAYVKLNFVSKVNVKWNHKKGDCDFCTNFVAIRAYVNAFCVWLLRFYHLPCQIWYLAILYLHILRLLLSSTIYSFLCLNCVLDFRDFSFYSLNSQRLHSKNSTWEKSWLAVKKWGYYLFKDFFHLFFSLKSSPTISVPDNS